MEYTILFSTATGKSAVHTPNCSCVKDKKRGMVRVLVEAESARVAREQYATEEQLVERGLPKTTIAPCAKEA